MFVKANSTSHSVQCVYPSPYHVLYRHGLWGHGRGAPLCGRHGLILPVLASRQLLLSRLVPLHLWPGERRAEQQKKLLFFSPLAQPRASLSNNTKIMSWKKEHAVDLLYLLVDSFYFLLFFIVPREANHEF